MFGVSETVQGASDRQFADDRHAYKRLRDEGLQPRSIRGAALLEKTAESKFEVENGKRLTAKLGARVDEAVQALGQP